jgi:hypothetical protein
MQCMPPEMRRKYRQDRAMLRAIGDRQALLGLRADWGPRSPLSTPILRGQRRHWETCHGAWRPSSPGSPPMLHSRRETANAVVSVPALISLSQQPRHHHRLTRFDRRRDLPRCSKEEGYPALVVPAITARAPGCPFLIRMYAFVMHSWYSTWARANGTQEADTISFISSSIDFR